MNVVRTLLFVTLVAAASNAVSQTPEAGRLLVSNPGLNDSNFSETVMLILVHEENGTAAIFLNRPTWIDPHEAFPEIETLAEYDGALFRGGPVAPAELLLLFEHEGAPPAGVLPVLDGVYFSPNPGFLGEIESTAPDAPRVRLFAGRAEWGPGQLAREIASGSWRVVRADADDLFAEDTTTLWQRMPLAGDGVTAFLE